MLNERSSLFKLEEMRWLNAFTLLAILNFSLIPSTNGKKVKVTYNKDPGRCDLNSRGTKVIVVDNNDNDRVLICVRSDGEFNWKALDNAPTLGEYFDPADDCSEIAQKKTGANDGFYWIKPFGLQKATKVWCDVTTDGGGFMLIGHKDSPVSWTLPSNAGVVSPNGKPHLSSMFGNVSMLEFRVQVSSTNDIKHSKADWLYRFQTPRRLSELLMSDQGGCTNHFPGVGYIEYVKDLLARKSVTQNFQCSRFGPSYIPNLGWKRMNQCLGQTCKQGFAMIPGIANIQYDSFGSFSYSTNSNRSGIIHNSAAFIGCEHGKCCACFGPKGTVGDFCSPGCRSINGGTVSKKAHAWFWIRSSVPEQPFWKKCMEYIVQTRQGHLETHFIDPNTGVLKKGSCKKKDVANLVDGVVQVANKSGLDNIPLVKGLMSYQEDNSKLYVSNGQTWEALGEEKQIDQQEKQIDQQEKQIVKQEKLIDMQEKQIDKQEKQINKQEKQINKLDQRIIKQEKKNKNLTSILKNEQKNITQIAAASKSCADWYKNGKRLNGVYTINPDALGTFDVWCDMTTDGGGWTVFQRRMDGSVNFYRGWTDYKNGFGNLNGEFWLGLDKIHRLSKSGQTVLRVDLGDFSNNKAYAVYNTFAVSGETEKYKLTVGSYSGNAGDSLSYHNGMKFTTKDVDNDQYGSNCAVTWKGAWWYNSCHYSNLNGLYRSSPHNSDDSVNWYHWKKSSYSFKNAEMKIRPRQF